MARSGVRSLAALAVAATVVLSACGSSVSTPTPTTAPATVAATATATTAATAPPSAGPVQKLILAYPLPCGFSDYWQALCDGANDAAAKLGPGFSFEIKSMTTLDVPGYLDLLTNIATLKPAAITVVPADPKTEIPVLSQIASAGTKVVSVDSPIPDFPQLSSFIGTDNLAAGQMAGKYVVGLSNLKSKKIAMLIQAVGYATSTDQRAAGFKSAVEAAGFSVVSEQVASCQQDAARSTAENILTAHPDIAVFYSVCDMNALGAAKALTSANITGVVNVGVDGLPVAVQAIIDKQNMTATIAQNPFTEGQLLVETMADLASGKTVATYQNSGAVLVTADNASKYVSYKH